MKVLVNGVSAQVGGGLTVLQTHLRAMASAATPNTEFIVLVGRQTELVAPDARFQLVRIPKLPTLVRVALEQLILPIAVVWRKVDVIYCVGNAGLLLPSKPVVMLLQSPHHFAGLRPSPHLMGYSQRRLRRYRVEACLARATARRARTVCVVSGTLGQAARREWPEVGRKLRVTMTSLPDDPPAVQLLQDPPSFCLAVANDYAHKEWTRIERIFHEASDLPPLVIVGRPSKSRGVELTAPDEIPQELRRRRVLHLGPITDRPTLLGLYRSAQLVLSHSRSETFGISVIEGAAHTGRIVAADIPAHREVGAVVHARFYDVDDDEALRQSVRTALQQPRRRARHPDASVGTLGEALLGVLASAAGKSK